jgi:hypothetical protein
VANHHGFPLVYTTSSNTLKYNPLHLNCVEYQCLQLHKWYNFYVPVHPMVYLRKLYLYLQKQKILYRMFLKELWDFILCTLTHYIISLCFKYLLASITILTLYSVLLILYLYWLFHILDCTRFMKIKMKMLMMMMMMINIHQFLVI